MEQIEQTSLYYLEKAPVPKAIAHMVVPMLLSFIATLIYNMTDAFYIGMLHNTPMMAAVTLALPFSALLMALGNLLGAGAGTYISRLLGEEKLEKARTACSVNFWSSLAAGILFTAVCLPLLMPLLELLGARGDTLLQTKNYIWIFVLGAPFVIASFSLEHTVRAEGASTVSMIGMLAGVLVNILLDPVFIFLLHMDIMGAALASVLGNLVSAIWYAYYLQRKSPVQSISLKAFKPSREIYRSIFKIGISAFLLDGFLVVTGLLFNNFAAFYGDSVVAGFGISQRVVQIVDFIGMSFSMGVVPLIAFSYSAKRQERLTAIIKTTALYMLGVTLGLSTLLFIFRAGIISLFSIDAYVLVIGQKILAAQLCSTLFAGMSSLFTGIFQAFGKGIQSTVMSVARGVVFIPILIIGHLLLALDGVIWAMTVSELLACITGLLLFFTLRKKEALSEAAN